MTAKGARQLPFLLDHPIPDKIEKAFARFHAAHPEVYGELEKLAIIWRSHSGTRWSVDAAYHQLRWQQVVVQGLPDPHEQYKLNDHYTALYARMLKKHHPEWDGMFETRKRRATE